MTKEKEGEHRAGHPWTDFLEARAVALVWLRDERKESPEGSAKIMSMDPTQVTMILAHTDARN